MSRRFAFASRRKSKVAQRTKNATIGIAIAPTRRRIATTIVCAPEARSSIVVAASSRATTRPRLPRRETGEAHASGVLPQSSAVPTLRLLGRPALLDVVEVLLERRLAIRHVAHHLGPELSGADLWRHLIRGIEAGRTLAREGRREDLGGVREDRVRIAVRSDVDVRRDPGAAGFGPHRALNVLAHERFQEVHDLRSIREHDRQLAGEEGRLLALTGEGEPVVVLPGLGVAEEGGDEAGL